MSQTPSVSRFFNVFALLSAFCIFSSTPSAADQRPVLQGMSVDQAPEIDGLLDDSQWRQAVWFSDFRQGLPRFGEPATEKTSVAVLFDRNTIFVGIRCEDSEPDKIIARRLNHRSRIGDDDNVAVVFDTYRNQQRGWFFQTNSLGAKREAQINGARQYNDDWEEVWKVAARRTPWGYSVEFAIPLRVLRFDNAEEQTWNINVVREIRRKREQVYLNPPEPPRDISSLQYHALLENLHINPDQRNLQFIPYALAGVNELPEDTQTTSDAGFDLKYSLTSSLTLDATYNTDFAQVEADDEQINLTRFSLFFPEKRDFFLENAQVFEFGSHRGGTLPFFSRRIGIENGRNVPIDVGARLSGTVDGRDIGLLSMRTAEVEEFGIESAWFNVGRVKQRIQGRSFIGALVTDSRRGDLSSTTWGVDGSWWLNNNLELKGYLSGVREAGLDDQNHAFSLMADYTTDSIGFFLSHNQIGENYDPDLGFVRRNGFRQYNYFFRFTQRPNALVRNWSAQANGNWLQVMEGPVESSRQQVEYSMELDSGDSMELKYVHSFERLFRSFNFSDRIQFLPGDYSFNAIEWEIESADHRRWGVELKGQFGTFFDADRRDMGLELSYAFNKHLRADFEIENLDFSRGEANENWTLAGTNIHLAFTSNLSLASFLQYNSESGAFIANVRAHLIYGDDSDLFIVFNERRFEDAFDDWRLEDRQAIIKVTYRIFF